MKLRFEIGSRVRLVGRIAEYYPGLMAVVISAREHQSGLAHLNEYWLRLSDGIEERFYEFQLASVHQDFKVHSSSEGALRGTDDMSEMSAAKRPRFSVGDRVRVVAVGAQRQLPQRFGTVVVVASSSVTIFRYNVRFDDGSTATFFGFELEAIDDARSEAS